MSVRIKCQCGKILSLKDELRGKQIKCPGCGKPLRVPTGTPAAAKAGTSAAAKAGAGGAKRPASGTASGAAGDDSEGLDDLFAEEGFSRQVAAVCPACRSEMAASAVLCTKCGYNKQTGQRLEGHKTPGVDIDMGTLALMKAESSMQADQEIQDRMLSRTGMPWWMLGLVLFVMIGGVGVLTYAVNASKQVEGQGANVNVMGMFLAISGGGFYLVSLGAALVILVKAFQKSLVEGLLYMFVPFYAIYFWFKYWKEVWKPLVLSIIAGGIAAGLVIAAMGSLQGA